MTSTHSVLKAYFTTLGDSAHPESSDPRVRQITNFQELCRLQRQSREALTDILTRSSVVVAFREFSIITDETIASERKRFRAEVVVSIETFAKRSAIRNLKTTGRLDKEQLGLAYDHFQLASLRSKDKSRRASMADSPRGAGTPKTPSVSSMGPDSTTKELEKVEERIDRKAFGLMIADIATWARDETLVKNGFHEHVDRKSVDHELIDRIFFAWDTSLSGALSFQVSLRSSLSFTSRC